MPDALRNPLAACVLAAGLLAAPGASVASAATEPIHAEAPAYGSGVPAATLETGNVHPAGDLGHASGHGGGHADSYEHNAEPNLFAGSIFQSLAAIVAFILLLLILRKYAWGQILTGLQDRENKIKGDLEHAAGKHAEAEAVLADYRNQLKGIQAEAQTKIDEARKAGEAVKAKLIADAEAHGARLRERAEKEIAAAKETAIAEVYEKSAVLSTEIAAKILGREIDADAQQDLVSDSLREFESRMATNN